ncbi:EscJ/YscJ/HrcJ family type III secretion inner membrane ring protein [Limnohabitans sp. 2KL-17]|uniref:type III secretion system inner membrane ring lipoprotein SctJ n=1 Tax=Limnohabitans sp. 2KL-17 TaxID=1100704 RepID=UPI000D3BAB74|nr:type III secretion inner membrane ring lipoprotein SctJ [Limnohabitans sp. 2KL-17]PUE49831.1 EscJ/YscJ/HrcJ family type III secretion inner membrane ring protein [Limnohabitans sp. 2KL-17]
MSAYRWCCVSLVLVLLGCSSRIDLFTGMSEQDANEVVSALIQAGVDGEKVAVPKQGFTVRVAKDELAVAVPHLYNLGLPRNTYQRLGDVFKKDGVVSTPIEERSRYLYALSQELENTLSQIDGVILARVHPVLPERLVPGEPAQPSSCSVLVKHRSDWSPTLYEDRIRRLVVSSIPGLARAPHSAVSIVFVSAAPAAEGQVGHPKPAPGPMPWGRWLMMAGLMLVLLLSAGLLVWQWLIERHSSHLRAAKVTPDFRRDD